MHRLFAAEGLAVRPSRQGQIIQTLARDTERLFAAAPDDTRRVLHRVARGDLGRLSGPEALGARLSRNVMHLTRAISFAALVIVGSMVMLTPSGDRHWARS